MQTRPTATYSWVRMPWVLACGGAWAHLCTCHVPGGWDGTEYLLSELLACRLLRLRSKDAIGPVRPMASGVDETNLEDLLRRMGHALALPLGACVCACVRVAILKSPTGKHVWRLTSDVYGGKHYHRTGCRGGIDGNSGRGGGTLGQVAQGPCAAASLQQSSAARTAGGFLGAVILKSSAPVTDMGRDSGRKPCGS
jgi:hypothetical protein